MKTMCMWSKCCRDNIKSDEGRIDLAVLLCLLGCFMEHGVQC